MAAGSVALIGFGIDSFVESISGSVLIWRLRAETAGGADEERDRDRSSGGPSAWSACRSLSSARTSPSRPSDHSSGARSRPPARSGIALTLLSLVVMLWLARAKRRTGEALASRALIADSQQTFACWYLSATTLAGLGLERGLRLWWADPVAALVIVALPRPRGHRGVARAEDD